jgi:hypothetical protein
MFVTLVTPFALVGSLAGLVLWGGYVGGAMYFACLVLYF